MAEDSFQERTEPATEKKRSEARQRGTVMKSIELNSAVGLFFGLLILYVSGNALAVGMADLMRETFVNAGSTRVTANEVHSIVTGAIVKAGIIVAPLCLGLFVIGLGTSFAQVGFVFSPEALQPKWEKLNPLTGMKKILVSRRSMVELAKNLLKVTIVGGIAYAALDSVIADSVNLMDSDVESVLGFMAKASLGVGLKTGLAFLALAVVDYFYQRFEFERDMRMTKQEVKEESKQQEGDPLVKNRIRGIQRRIAYKRMMQDVPKADVVVTNPTHLAVALRYEAGAMSAPKVVAKGADLIAQRIKALALEHEIPIVEDKPLAQALYKSVDVGEEVPEKLFQAVAQLLAYIYRLKKVKPSLSVI